MPHLPPPPVCLRANDGAGLLLKLAAIASSRLLFSTQLRSASPPPYTAAACILTLARAPCVFFPTLSLRILTAPRAIPALLFYPVRFG